MSYWTFSTTEESPEVFVTSFRRFISNEPPGKFHNEDNGPRGDYSRLGTRSLGFGNCVPSRSLLAFDASSQNSREARARDRPRSDAKEACFFYTPTSAPEKAPPITARGK